MDAVDWDARYDQKELVWGAEPNRYVAQWARDLSPGVAVDLASGEGRNAVWLARQGWQVQSLDYSPVAVERSKKLADEELDDSELARFSTFVSDVTEWSGHDIDLVVVCYLHVDQETMRQVWRSAVNSLNKSGTVIIIGHDTSNFSDGVGGPQDTSVLFDPDDVLSAVDDLPVQVVHAAVERRPVDGADRPALDAVVVLRR